MGLLKIMGEERRRGKQVEKPPREIVSAAVADDKLFGKVIKGPKCIGHLHFFSSLFFQVNGNPTQNVLK